MLRAEKRYLRNPNFFVLLPTANSKLRTKCTLPLTGVKCIKKIVSDFGVIEITDFGFVLLEYAPDMTAEQVMMATEGKMTLAPDCRAMKL